MPRPSPLMVRIFSGAVILLAFLALVLMGRPGVYFLVFLLGGLALYEFRLLSGRMGYRAPSWVLYPLGAYLALSGTLLKGIEIQAVLSLALILGLGAFVFAPGRRQGLGRWAMGVAGAIYIGIPFDYYLLLYGTREGLAWILSVILVVVSTDVAALLAGMRFGRHPFLPAISPRKTTEGAVAGLLGAVVVMLILGIGLLAIPPWHAVALGVLIGVMAELGDLVESQMKRLAEVKDSSHLIPGHGGVLDRLDSVLFPPIVVFLYATFFHLL
jgi:phosphatidate cytidylyltransferase